MNTTGKPAPAETAPPPARKPRLSKARRELIAALDAAPRDPTTTIEGVLDYVRKMRAGELTE